MLLKSILNRIQLHHGFVYGAVRLFKKTAHLLLEIEIRPRKGSRPICSVCGKPGPGYDTLQVRRFEFVRCGVLPCSSCMPCGGSIALVAA